MNPYHGNNINYIYVTVCVIISVAPPLPTHVGLQLGKEGVTGSAHLLADDVPLVNICIPSRTAHTAYTAGGSHINTLLVHCNVIIKLAF